VPTALLFFVSFPAQLTIRNAQIAQGAMVIGAAKQ
jgi:hypothetical protein